MRGTDYFSISILESFMFNKPGKKVKRIIVCEII